MAMLHLYGILLCLMTDYDSLICGSEVKSKLSIIDLPLVPSVPGML